MKWLTSLVLLAVIGGVHLQCFTSNDDFNATTFNTDLSDITDFNATTFNTDLSGITDFNATTFNTDQSGITEFNATAFNTDLSGITDFNATTFNTELSGITDFNATTFNIDPSGIIDFNDTTFNTDISGITDFGLELYKQLSPAQSSKNFFFSPYSIWSALTLAYFGSAGNTQRQLETKLRVSDKVSTIKLWKALESLYELQQKNNTLYTFNLANRVYFDNSLQLTPCMKNILQKELRNVNFSDTVGSAKDINTFVNETTKGRISEVVQPGDLIDAVMVLVNAAFFKGTWKFQFSSSATHRRDFFITPQESVPVAMMARKGHFRYGESQQLGARVLELPYSGDAISMFILLPTTDGPAKSRFTNMVNNLNGATLRDAINPSNMKFLKVDVQLPKFKLDMKIEEELETALKNLGIVDLFDSKLANMTAFEPSGDLSVDSIIHKSFVEVDEGGTEAGAVTLLLILQSMSFTVPFHCNEPFIFVIHDIQTKNILFMGAFKNPRG